MNKLQYTLWLKDPKDNWLYEWANIFKSAEDAREYRRHLEEGLRPGFKWVVVEKEVNIPEKIDFGCGSNTPGVPGLIR